MVIGRRRGVRPARSAVHDDRTAEKVQKSISHLLTCLQKSAGGSSQRKATGKRCVVQEGMGGVAAGTVQCLQGGGRHSLPPAAWSPPAPPISSFLLLFSRTREEICEIVSRPEGPAAGRTLSPPYGRPLFEGMPPRISQPRRLAKQPGRKPAIRRCKACAQRERAASQQKEAAVKGAAPRPAPRRALPRAATRRRTTPDVQIRATPAA